LGAKLSEQRKKRLEQRIATEFLLEYNCETGAAFGLLRSGVPPEPDVLCEDARTHLQMGVEIGTAYYGEEHARSVWEPVRGRKAAPYLLNRPDSVENKRVLSMVNRIIRSKSQKSYSSPGRVLLVVALEPIRLYLERMKGGLRSLRIPATHPFDEVYVFSTQGEPYELFPSRKWIGTYRALN
jgi:hypothetical protein